MLWEVLLAVAAILAAGLVIYAAIEARSVRVTRLEIRTPGLPAAFDGFTIMHVSDLHFRRGRSFPTLVETAVCGIKADLIAITGDIAYSRTGLPHFERLLGVLKQSAPNALILACTGNGEILHPRVGEMAQTAIENAGGRMLHNESIQMDREGELVFVIGVDDPFTRRDDLDVALANVPADAFKILLAHSPSIARKAVDAGIDLILCGHTHGGQVRLPSIGAIYARTGFSRAVNAGLYESESLYRALGLDPSQAGFTNLYISRGVGTSHVPIRFLCPPEIAIIRLRRG